MQYKIWKYIPAKYVENLSELKTDKSYIFITVRNGNDIWE